MELHYTKLLKEIFYENAFQQSETLVLMKDVIKCQKCISNENLCQFHSKLLKSSIINDVNNWIKDTTLVEKK